MLDLAAGNAALRRDQRKAEYHAAGWRHGRKWTPEWMKWAVNA